MACLLIASRFFSERQFVEKLKIYTLYWVFLGQLATLHVICYYLNANCWAFANFFPSENVKSIKIFLIKPASYAG